MFDERNLCTMVSEPDTVRPRFGHRDVLAPF